MAMKKIDVAQGDLTDALAAVVEGDEVVLTKEGRPVARLLPMQEHATVPLLGPRKAGSARGLFTVPDDFDAPLVDFRDYL
jgi:prevent-host-death family protein